MLLMRTHPGRLVTVYTFTQLFHTAWDKAMTPDTIPSGFRATGVYPVNRHAVKITSECTPKRESIAIEDIESNDLPQ